MPVPNLGKLGSFFAEFFMHADDDGPAQTQATTATVMC